MAQLVIVVRDKVCGDYYADARNYKRGDVALVYADDQRHSREMLTNPNLRIVTIPSLSVAEAKALLAPQVLAPDEQFVTEKTRQRRGFKFDIDDPLIPADLRACLDDDTRKQPIFTSNAEVTLARALRKEKPGIPDPSRESMPRPATRESVPRPATRDGVPLPATKAIGA